MPHALLNGANLYYETHRTSTNEALVLLHSGLVDSRVWREQIEKFAVNFQVVAYDIRGFGRSEQPTKPFRNIDDLLALLDHLNIPQVHLIGCSMGGAIALDFAVTYPERVRSLVLSGTSLNGYTPTSVDVPSEQRSRLNRSYILRDDQFEEAVEELLRDPMWQQNTPEKHDFLRTLFREQDMRWFVHSYWIPLIPTAAERLSEIAQPVLLVLGDREPNPIYEIAEVLMKSLPHVTRIDLPDAGHLPCLQQPEAFHQAVLKFLVHN